jgi:DUF4097 and DUF4098 domain-containing protein YvlB
MSSYATRFAAIVGCAAIAAACSIQVQAQENVVKDEKRFTVSGEPELTVRTFDGSIRVRSWNRNEVLVEIEKRANTRDEAERLEVRTDQQGDRILIEAEEPRDRDRDRRLFSRWWQEPSISLTITVPRKLTINARSGDGSMTIEDIEGDIALNTGDGSITGDDIAGTLNARTGDGSIRITDVRGSVDVTTGDGSITMDGQFRELRAQTGDGSVRVDARNGSSLDRDWSVRSGDGSITLDLDRDIDAEISADSRDGSVRASGSRMRVLSRSEDRDSLRARLGSGGRQVRLQSGDGSITISSR